MEQVTVLRRLLAISEAGLAYAQDRFDQERYQDLQRLAQQQLATLGDWPVAQVADLFAQETGYPTPKIDVRAFITRQRQVLLVKDATGHWALPGGFAEVGWSLKANVAKEVREETGLAMTVGELRAIYDTAQRPDIPQAFQYYKMIFAGTIGEGEFAANSETIATSWFSEDALPPLSLKRTTPEQLHQLFAGGEAYIQ